MDITIIRTSSNGDIVLTEPIFEALKKMGYTTNIITKKEYFPLVKNNPHIDKIIFPNDIKDFKTDILVDLQRNPLSKRIRRKIKRQKLVKVKKYYKERFLYVNFHKKPNFPDVITRYKEAVEIAIGQDMQLKKIKFFPAKNIEKSISKPFITLALSSKWYTKSYPYIEELINLLLERTKFNIAFVGSNNILLHDPKFFNLAEKFPIDESASIIKDSSCIITVDSLWMHIGLGLDLKTVSIFGSTTPQLGFVSPYNMPDKIIESNLKCRPCTKIGKKKCPRKDFKCMRNLMPNLIWDIIKNECNS